MLRLFCPVHSTCVRIFFSKCLVKCLLFFKNYCRDADSTEEWTPPVCEKRIQSVIARSALYVGNHAPKWGCLWLREWVSEDFWWFLRRGYGPCTRSSTYWYFDEKIQPLTFRTRKKMHKLGFAGNTGIGWDPFSDPFRSHFFALCLKTSSCS